MQHIKDVMTPTPHSISLDASLREAAKEMEKYECEALVVCEETIPRGVVTDRDIVVFGLASDYDLDTTDVKDVITTDVIACYERKTLEQAADIMSVADVHRLVIVNRQEQLVGVLSMADMMKCTDNKAVNDDVIHLM